MIAQLCQIMKHNTIDELMVQVSKNMGQIFMSEKIYLCMADAVRR